MSEDVLFLEPNDTFEEGATFTVLENGGLSIDVAEEQAVDSYNQSFECTINLTPEQVARLRAWLDKRFSGTSGEALSGGAGQAQEGR